jgi:excinuclease ABC subunit A
VGTVTEIHDYLRLLFARAGTPHCPQHGVPLQASSVAQMVDAVLALPAETRLLLMAPVARERKGEFAEVFTQMQAQGFVRFRVDGQVVELAELPALAKKEKHDIDVVIDRLKVRPDMAQRIAESMETALRLADGRALVLDLDQGVEHAFNAKFACPHCSFAIGELEPRLFSFNSPLGACPTCEGLGEQSFFDPARIVAFPDISLASGAIKGWDKRNAYYFAMLESLARHYQFDLETPFEQLPPSVQQVLLFGSGEEEIKFSYVLESGARAGRKTSKQHRFEGIVHNMARRYTDTDSALVREELSRYRGLRPCEACEGTRLRTEARHVRLGVGPQALTVHDVSHLTLSECQAYFQGLTLDGNKADIADKVVREIANRLKFLNDVGLTYLSLSRSADTLSGGEAQRIRLASQIGSGLTGVMYVLDEPSIGLHQRDNDRLIDTLKHLRDIGNSVLVVEHDEDMIRAADHCIDMGPGAGVHGGRVMAQGTPAQLQANPHSLTGRYMSGALSIAVPPRRRDWLLQTTASAPPPANNVFGLPMPSSPKSSARQALTVVGARGHNLQNVTVAFPVGLFTCVTGVSGSGKSTLVNDTLYAAVARQIHRAHEEPAAHDDILGLYHFDKVINVDQSPIGRTPRSNPATYTGLFTPLRELMADVPMARERGYGPGRFSFNVDGGRCNACQGDGMVKVEMHFLPDVYVPCDVCLGERYNRETLDVQYKGKNIAQILNMTVEDALAFFKPVPALARKLNTLMEVGLGYIRLGQAATTLSGGEAQRVKLALELSKRDTGKTLYILDEPTTGLHFADIDLLLKVLQQLVQAGNTVVVIEHNLDVIKTADWVIDMGPQGGVGGGQVVATGTPEQVAGNPDSVTGRYLRRLLSLD